MTAPTRRGSLALDIAVLLAGIALAPLDRPMTWPRALMVAAICWATTVVLVVIW